MTSVLLAMVIGNIKMVTGDIKMTKVDSNITFEIDLYLIVPQVLVWCPTTMGEKQVLSSGRMLKQSLSLAW